MKYVTCLIFQDTNVWIGISACRFAESSKIYCSHHFRFDRFYFSKMVHLRKILFKESKGSSSFCNNKVESDFDLGHLDFV